MPIDPSFSTMIRRRLLSDPQAEDVKLAMHLLWSGRLRSFLRWRKNERWRDKRRVSRIVIAYDLHRQPVSVGDMLISLEAGLTLREQHRADDVEMVLLADPNKRSIVHAFSHLEGHQIHEFASTMSQVLSQFEHVSHVHLFGRRSPCEHFLGNQSAQHLVWPSALTFAGKPSPGTKMRTYASPVSGNNMFLSPQAYLYYEIHNHILHNFFQKNGRLPELRLNSKAQGRVHHLFEKMEYRIPISVHLRWNENVQPERNSNFAGWRKFFQHALQTFPDVGFVVVGTRGEADQLGEVPANVFIAKNAGTDLTMDMAIIRGCAGHLGEGSGPGMVAEFGSRPYSYWTPTLLPTLYVGARQEGAVAYFSHCTKNQKMIMEPQSDASILHYGSDLVQAAIFSARRST